jgi:AbrB family looped-hinge helix DNA binding protein
MSQQYRAKITSKGQITLPRQVREELGVQDGDSIVFAVEAGEIQVLPVRDSSPFSHYQGIGNLGIDDGREEIDAWLRDVRGHAANSD